MSPAARKASGATPQHPPGAPACPPLLRDLLIARGPSGYETAPAGVWRDAASEFAQVSTDLVGTPLALVAPKHGYEQAPRRLLVMGHIDEIGLIVTHIDDDGYLWFREVGGWDAQILVGQRVVLDTRDGPVAGVVGKKPIHLLRDEERKKVAEIRDLHIDIGARDGEQARELVRIGDVAVIDAQPLELPNGRLTSRALDNRLGSFVALEAARLSRRPAVRSGRSPRSPPHRRRSPSAARARARSRSSPTRRSSSTSPTPPTRPGSTSRRPASTSSAQVP